MGEDESRWPMGWAGLFGGGLLMGIAPVNAWPLAWVALVPLWLVVTRPQQPIRRSFMGALLWGAAYHGVALSWMTSLHPLTWLGIPWLGSLAIMLFAWAFITLWGAGIGLVWVGVMVGVSRWKLATGSPLSGGARVLVGTAIWCAVEWVWSRGPLYWSSLSYTQSPHNLVGLQWGQLSGPLGVTAAIVAVNGLLAQGVLLGKGDRENAGKGKRGTGERGKGERGKGRWSFGGWERWVAGAIALFIGLHVVGVGLYGRPLADRPSEVLAVGLVQGNIPTNQKLTGQGIQMARQAYVEGYEVMVAAGADLVVTPEGAIPQRWNSFLQARNLLQRAVVKNGVPLVLGTFVSEDIADAQTPLTQSLLTLTPEGKVMGRYNKVKLVPLGEYLPFENILERVISRLSPLVESMAPGRFDQVLDTPFGPMAAGICYDSAFAALFRQQVLQGGQLILTASNNDPYPPRMLMQHHGQDVMRAIETDRWAVRVTNTGLSGVVDPRGRSHWLSVPNEYVTHLASIYRRQTRTLYVRWGDWLTPLLLVIALIAIVWA